MKIKFGDLVDYKLDGFEGQMFCIGMMQYAPDGVALLATDQYIGFPINVSHCSVVSEGHDEVARSLRRKYEDQFKNVLQEL